MKSNSKAIEGRSSAPCSPTPETAKAWDDASKGPDGNYYSNVRGQDMAAAMLNHSRNMERERDEARRLAERFASGHDVTFRWENVPRKAVTPAPSSSALANLTRQSPSSWPCPPKKSRSAKLLIEATYRLTGAACVITDGERPPWTMRVHFPSGQAFSFHPSRVDDWFILHNAAPTRPALPDGGDSPPQT